MENYWLLTLQQIMIMNLKLLILIEIPPWAPSTASTQEISVGRVFPSSAWVSTLWLLCEGGAEKGEQVINYSSTRFQYTHQLPLVITVHHRARRDTGTVTVNWALEPSVQDVELFWIRNTWTIDNAIKVWRTENWSWGKR